MFQSPWRGFWVGGFHFLNPHIQIESGFSPLGGDFGLAGSAPGKATEQLKKSFSPLGGDFGLAGVGIHPRPRD